MYKKILVPYDGSEPSDNALNHAIEIAKMSGEDVRIILLHILQEIHLPPSFSRLDNTLRSLKTGDRITPGGYLKELYVMMKAEALQMLNEKKKECEARGISTDVKILFDHAIDTIIQFSTKEDVDLIVMGTTGLSGISRIRALGSVARNVSERASCPVLLVH